MFSKSLSTLLLDRHLRTPIIKHFLKNFPPDVGRATDSDGNFYSPLGSSNASDEESEDIGISFDPTVCFTNYLKNDFFL